MIFNPIVPKFRGETWSIKKLIILHQENRLKLDPHYQRNAIWSVTAQRRLIDTIQRGYPLPSFFVRVLTGNRFEMVDGQQRSRTILGYWNAEFTDSNKVKLTPDVRSNREYQNSLSSYLDYSLSINILDESVTDEEVEAFYVLVNSSGVKLNRPELRKAEFYDTTFLRLVTEVADDPVFDELDLFTDQSIDRMNDIDFVSELVTFLKHGFTDKKEKVDATFKADISEQEATALKQQSVATLRRIASVNEIEPINGTRFKQKGDFYTFFAFIALNSSLPDDFFKHCYETIIKLSSHIRPSQEECDPLMEYALNCVSQSNSKRAREKRNEFFQQCFLNESDRPTGTQAAIAEYLNLSTDCYFQRWGKLLIKLECLNA